MFQACRKTRKTTFLGRSWAKLGLPKLSQMLIRSGEILSPRQTSIDKNNDCAIKPERGAVVRGCDQCSRNDGWHVTGAGQASDANIFGELLCRKQATNYWYLSHGKSRIFFRFGRRAYDAAGNVSPLRWRTHLISSRPSSTLTVLAKHESGWSWVDSMSRSNAYRCVSCFWSACWQFSTWRRKLRRVQQREQII